ncbi:MAG: sensor histidine kinase [Chloroflexota bacterium]
MTNIKFLRQVPLLTNISDDILRELAPGSEEINLRPGQFLVRQGQPGGDAFFVLEGELEGVEGANAEGRVRAVITVGELTGQIALMLENPYPLTFRATRPSRVISVSAVNMARLFNATAENVARYMEKMAALGKLAAGLAHELNNPATAARRASEQLRDVLTKVNHVGFNLQRYALSDEQHRYMVDLQKDVSERAATAEPLSPIEQSDREAAISAWLDERGVPDGWEMASILVQAGLGEAELAQVAEGLPAEALGDALTWIAGNANVAQIERSLDQSTQAITDLVTAIKAYSHLDQSPVKDVDIHDGIESTLIILNHKLKKGIRVEREYDRSLPLVEVYGNDLNQVWTNLIDNAIDALPDGQGQITVRTSRREGDVVVEIADNGTGIPDELQCRIFEPFFTTKELSKGNGLGLDIAHRIITERYGGDVYFRSSPGSTRFWVHVPIVRGAAKPKPEAEDPAKAPPILTVAKNPEETAR